MLDESESLRVFLGLLHGDIVKGAVAQVQHIAGLVVFAFQVIAFGQSVTCLGEFDFALGVFFENQAELVA